MENKEVLLKLEGITKTYSGVTVLSNVDFDLKKGEVHALMGENGAGKSTLSKIVSGVIDKTSGKMYLRGEEYNPNGTGMAVEKGISIVHQEFNLIPSLTVAQNVFLGKEKLKIGLINEKNSNLVTQNLLEQLGVNIPLNKKVRELSVAQQQMVEIVKCLSDNSDIIIMDEPTATLTENETKQLFDIIRKLQKKGVTFIYISHKLNEIFAISQRITVLRDGKKIGTYNTSDLPENKLVALMVGREISSLYNHHSNVQNETVLKVEGLSRKGLVKDVSFELKKGEILGFGGLVGSGRTELMKMIWGEYPIDSGKIEVLGRQIRHRTINSMIKQGVVYLSESRKEEGLLVSKSVKENITLAVMNKVSVGPFIRSSVESKLAKKMSNDLNVKTNGILQKVAFLSGGNQQKVVLAKWLATDLKIIILDEPTRGIDVGSKQEIYQLMNGLCEQGISIIMISSEMPELIGMCDRIIVLSDGKVSGELSGDEMNETSIMNVAIQRGYNLKEGVEAE